MRVRRAREIRPHDVEVEHERSEHEADYAVDHGPQSSCT